MSLGLKQGGGQLTPRALALGNSLAQHIVAMDPGAGHEGSSPANAVAALLKQSYVFQPTQTVGDLLAAEGKAMGGALEIRDYVRWCCGGKA